MSRSLTSISIIVLTMLVSRSFSQCNNVDTDGLTSASFRITSGEACSTHINLEWNFRHRNGEMIVEWGSTNEYGNSKSIYSDNPVSIPDLTPGTEYFIHTYGLYRNRTYDFYSFSVTTAAGSPTNEAPEITSEEVVSCTTGQTTTYTVTATDADDDELTFTAEDLPDWATFESPVLTLDPLSESSDAEITLITDDGNGGMDTLVLSVEVIVSTSVITNRSDEQPVIFHAGATRIVFVPSSSRYVTITLHKLNGAAIFQRKIPFSSIGEFSLPAHIPSGIYLLGLRDGTGIYGRALNVRN